MKSQGEKKPVLVPAFVQTLPMLPDPSDSVSISDVARGIESARRDVAEQIHRDDLARAVKSVPKSRSKMSRMEKIRDVLQNGAKRVEGHLLDSFTASMLCQVYDALSPENQKKFADLPLAKMVNVGWKLAGGTKKK